MALEVNMIAFFYTVQSNKKGLNSFYIKRIVLDDGIHIVSVDLQ